MRRIIVQAAIFAFIALALWSFGRTVFGSNNPMNLLASATVVLIAMFVKMQWDLYEKIVPHVGKVDNQSIQWALKLLAMRPPQVLHIPPSEKSGDTSGKSEQGG